MNPIAKKTIESLRKNNINADYFENSQDAVSQLLKDISKTESVGIGGSVTVKSLGIPEKLLERGNTVYFHWLATPENMSEIRRKALSADCFISSTNALTQKGQLVNIDGVGNRAAGMVYGPKKVFILCGINKVVENIDAAMTYIKDNAHKNARRLGLKTPCAITGKCNDCDSLERMCSVTFIIEKKPKETDIKVYLINEDLGF